MYLQSHFKVQITQIQKENIYLAAITIPLLPILTLLTFTTIKAKTMFNILNKNLHMFILLNITPLHITSNPKYTSQGIKQRKIYLAEYIYVTCNINH